MREWQEGFYARVSQAAMKRQDVLDKEMEERQDKLDAWARERYVYKPRLSWLVESVAVGLIVFIWAWVILEQIGF